MFSDLPNELLLHVASCLSTRDLNAVAQTSRRFFHVLDPCLYRPKYWSIRALWWAARHNRDQTARKAIEAGATGECLVDMLDGPGSDHSYYSLNRATAHVLGISWLNALAPEFCEPLTLAARCGSDGVAKQLLELHSVDASHRSIYGRTAIVTAVTCGHASIVKLLLDDHGVEPEHFHNRLMPTLYYAVKLGHIETTRVLLDSGQVDADRSFGYGRRTALSHAAHLGRERITELLLQTGRVDPDSRDRHGKSPFLWAIASGMLGTARILLETGKVDLNARSFIADRTPLHHAIFCTSRHPDENVIQMLVQLDGVDVNAKSKGHTPIMLAIVRRLVASVKVLLASGRVDPNLRIYRGMTVLHFSASLGRTDIANVLLDYDSDSWKVISGEGFSLLGTAAYHGRVDIVRILLQSGRFVNLNHRCGTLGGTPLWWAAAKGHRPTVKVLLDHPGGDVDMRAENDDGETPLEIARVYEHVRVVRLLRKRLYPVSRADRMRAKDDIFESFESEGEESLGSLFEFETG